VALVNHDILKVVGFIKSKKINRVYGTGEDNPGWKGGKKVKIICEWCGKEHLAYKHSKKRFCSDVCSSKWHHGERSGSWRGGRWLDKKTGYIKIKDDNSEGYPYRFEHRMVMEKFLGRRLQRWEQVHHINGIKNDNRIENLSVTVKYNHKGVFICPFCKNHVSLSRNQWQIPNPNT
jgi:hypothetical protein